MKALKKIFGNNKMSRICDQDDLSRLLAEINDAKRQFNYAQQNLNNAEEIFIDVAAKEVEFNKSRLNALLKKYKEERYKIDHRPDMEV